MNISALITASLLLALAVVSPAMVAMASAAESRSAITAQARVLTDATARGDAKSAASVFTTDARLMVPGVAEIVSGRPGVEGFWQSAFDRGLKGLELVPLDIEGDGALRIETGTYRALLADGAELGRGNYLFVWKREAGSWRIHRDIGSATPAPPASPLATGAAPVVRPAGGLPADYRALKLLGVSVGQNEPAIHTVYANESAATTLDGGQPPFPAGSVIIMEFANALRDGEGELVRERDGTPRRGEIVHVDMMRRGPEEWEFASFRADGGVLVAPEDGAQCAACHQRAGTAKDFVYRVGRAQ